MIIKTKKGSYISDINGMLLTDGMSYGFEYFLGNDRSVDELSEITIAEYEAITGYLMEEKVQIMVEMEAGDNEV